MITTVTIKIKVNMMIMIIRSISPTRASVVWAQRRLGRAIEYGCSARNLKVAQASVSGRFATRKSLLDVPYPNASLGQDPSILGISHMLESLELALDEGSMQC